MKKLKVYHAKLNNMGDMLNALLIKKCFGYDIVHHTYLTGEISGIGSGLGQFTLSEKKWLATLEKLSGMMFPKVHIWGTGFISYKQEDNKFYRKGIEFCAVRGELSKKRVERILGEKIDVPTGDAGILASYLLPGNMEKKYAVGIIAHYKEQSEPEFVGLVNQFDNSVLIDVMNDPLTVVRQIAECKVIISSSLHGLIVADSFGIPNRHIVVSDKLLGDGFKFDDYYSAYGLQHEYTDMKSGRIDDLELVINNYKITLEMVEQKKLEMLKCFPYPKVI